MLRIIALQNHKNHYLEKFYTLNETELLNFAKGDFSNLNHFYETRENILAAIRYIDAQLNEIEREKIETTNEQKREFTVNLNIKEQYVSRILVQDLEVLACIESEKSDIIRELQEIKRAKKAVSGYKSPTFKKHLDEEI
jgi:hypothetical protein